MLTPACVQKKHFHSPGDQRPTRSRTLRHAERCPGPRSCVGTMAYRRSLKRKKHVLDVTKNTSLKQRQTRRCNTLGVDQARRNELELRRPTKYTPWVPRIKVPPSMLCKQVDMKPLTNVKFHWHPLTLKDFALVNASNTKLHTLKTTNYKHSTKGDTFQSNYE